jgi:two-component sensor histidine kinase
MHVISGTPLELDADRVVALGLAINELVTNAAKHAFADRERGIIGVPLSSASGDLLPNVSDDGTGI